MISKIVCPVLFYMTSLVLFYMTNFNNVVTNTITKTHVSANSMITTIWNLLPAWISKPRHQQKKKRDKTSNNDGQCTIKLCANKKPSFNKRNYMLGQHNRMQHKVSRLCPPKLYQNHAHKVTRRIINHHDQNHQNQKVDGWVENSLDQNYQNRLLWFLNICQLPIN